MGRLITVSCENAISAFGNVAASARSHSSTIAEATARELATAAAIAVRFWLWLRLGTCRGNGLYG